MSLFKPRFYQLQWLQNELLKLLHKTNPRKSNQQVNTQWKPQHIHHKEVINALAVLLISSMSMRYMKYFIYKQTLVITVKTKYS